MVMYITFEGLREPV